jgi:hypothetical protein
VIKVMGGDQAKIGRATPVGPGRAEDLQIERKQGKSGNANPVGLGP